MKNSYYIARKFHQGKSEDKKVSQPIIRIARWSIILAMAINIITLAVVTGFQNEVTEKVVGFNAPISIVKAGETSVFETSPIVYGDSLLNSLQEIKGVNGVQPFAYKPAMLQSQPDTIWYNVKGKDTFQVQQEIHGVVVKGVGKNYDWTFFQNNLIDGEILPTNEAEPKNELLISADVARNLNLKVGSEINIFFVKKQPIRLKYIVRGIFKTGLHEFDEQVVVSDIRNVQHLNDWGIQSAIRVADTLTKDHQFVIYADSRGGNGYHRHNWGYGFAAANWFPFCGEKDTVIQLITAGYNPISDGYGQIDEFEIPDTAYLKISVEGAKNQPCFPLETNIENQFEKEFLNEDGTLFAVNLKEGKRIVFQYIDGKGSHENYIGGYEVTISDFKLLDEIANDIKRNIYFQGFSSTQEYNVRTITENQQEIFVWLDFLNVNVLIILVLMLLIGIINMGSGLLVLIITKTRAIGLLKAIGASNWGVRKIFLYQSFFIILRGLIFGNAIGIGICLLQQYFVIIPLNPEVYYLDAVPIEIHFLPILFLNIGTIILCVAALVIPSYVITKISPIKALKFD